MINIRRIGWLVGVVFVLLIFNAFVLWSNNRLLAVANLAIDGLIIVLSVIIGYRNAPKEQR